MKTILNLLFVYSIAVWAQAPDPAYHPMTAPDAIGIDWSDHILFWENPSDIQFNECYFSTDSTLVAIMDTSVRILNG